MSIEKISSFWPDWQIGELIGQGAYGKVYKAFKQEHSLLSVAAIKVITIPQSDAELEALRAEGLDERSSRTYFSDIVGDFINEIKLMESMKGVSNVVSVEDFKVIEHEDSIGWDIFIRMELLTPFPKYIEGKTLTEDEIIKLGCDVCTALEFCSKLNIIHRDIKPDNIFVSRFGDFKVGDFGVAKQLDKTASMLSAKGTHSYIAPEVLHAQSYDRSVDIYSLGIVLYKLLNDNRHPFITADAAPISYKDRENAIARRLSGEPLPPPCNASPELAGIILTACSYDPNKRFKNPTALKKALLNYKNSKAQTFVPPPVTPSNIKTEFVQEEAKASDLDRTVAVRPGIHNVPNTSNSSASYSYNQPAAPMNNSGYGQNPYSSSPASPPPPVPPSYTYPPIPPKKKKSKAPLIIIIVIAIILLFVGSGIAAWKLGIFDSISLPTQTEEKDDEPKNTTEEDSTEPLTEDPDTTEPETKAPDTTSADLPEPPVINEDSFYISETDGAEFFTSEKFTATATDIDFNDSDGDFDVNFKFKNNTDETLHVFIDYVAINTVVCYNPYGFEVAPGKTLKDYLYIYEDYCSAIGIKSVEDISSFVIFYNILDSEYNTLYTDSCEFVTENYDENIEVTINGKFFIEESDVKAIVYAFTSNYDTDLTIAVKSIDTDYRVHIEDFYINGIEYKFEDDEGYDIFADAGILMMDDIYLDDEDLATIGLTPEEVETVQFSGVVYDENNRRVYEFESEVFEAKAELPK